MAKAKPQVKRKKPRYIILKTGKLWESTDGALHLDQFQPENCYLPESDVPTSARTDVVNAIKRDVLAVTDTPKTFHKELESQTIAERKRKKLVWTDLDNEEVKANRRIPTEPSFSNHNLKLQHAETKAMEFLTQRNNKQTVKELPGYIGGMQQEDAVAFLQEMHYCELKGYNPSSHPRDSVISAIEGLLKNLGSSWNTLGVSKITSMEDMEADETEEPTQILIP